MQGLRRTLLAGCALACTLTACSGTKTPEPEEFNPLTDKWILLAEPISTPEDALLGTAYSPRDGDRFTGCYAFEPTEISSSFDTILLKKEESGSGEGFFRVLKALGIDASASRVAEASIQMDSVKIAQVSSVAPYVSDCAILRGDDMPRFPAIVAMIGVKKFAFKAQDAQQVNVTGEFAKATDTAQVEFDLSQSESATFSFDDYRWIGARFVGFDKLPDGKAQTFQLALDKLEIISVLSADGAEEREYEITVKKLDRGWFEVTTQRPLGPAFTTRVRERSAFRRGGGASRSSPKPVGHFLVGRLRSIGADSVALTVQPQGFERIAFVGEAERSKLMEWIRN